MRIAYALVLIVGLAAVIADHLTRPSSAARCRRRIRRRLRALRRALPVDTEKIARGSCRSDPCAIGSKFPRGPFAYEVRARARRETHHELWKRGTSVQRWRIACLRPPARSLCDRIDRLPAASQAKIAAERALRH